MKNNIIAVISLFSVIVGCNNVNSTRLPNEFLKRKFPIETLEDYCAVEFKELSFKDNIKGRLEIGDSERPDRFISENNTEFLVVLENKNSRPYLEKILYLDALEHSKRAGVHGWIYNKKVVCNKIEYQSVIFVENFGYLSAQNERQ